MKKTLMFFLILTLGWSVSNAQKSKITGRPCAKYDQNRNISEMRDTLMADGLYASNLRIAYAEAINRGIGKIIVTGSKDDIDYVLENTIFLDVNFVNTDDYLNGVRYGNDINFTTLVGQPSDKWAAFNYEGVDYIYAKVSCMNPQKPKKAGIYVEKKEPIVQRNDWSYKEPQKITPLNIPPQEEEKKGIKIGYILIPVGVLVLGGVVGYLLAHQNHESDNYVHHEHHQEPPPPPPPIDPGGPGGAPPPGGD